MSPREDAYQPIYEWNGGYRGWVNTGNGFVTKDLSNFQLRVVNWSESDNGTTIKVDVQMGGESRGQCELTNNDLLTREGLLAALGQPNAKWLGSDNQLQHLRAYLGGDDAEYGPRRPLPKKAKKAPGVATPPLFKWSEADPRKAPPKTYLVDRLLPSKGTHLVIAPPKAGKSQLMAHIGACIIDGRPVFGKYEVAEEAKSARILWLMVEESRYDPRERIENNLRGFGYSNRRHRQDGLGRSGDDQRAGSVG